MNIISIVFVNIYWVVLHMLQNLKIQRFLLYVFLILTLFFSAVTSRKNIPFLFLYHLASSQVCLDIYLSLQKYPEALRVALRLNDHDTIRQVFSSCSDRCAFWIALHLFLSSFPCSLPLSRIDLYNSLPEIPCLIVSVSLSWGCFDSM